MSDALCRDIKRDEGFDEAAAEIYGSVRAADDVLAGVEF